VRCVHQSSTGRTVYAKHNGSGSAPEEWEDEGMCDDIYYVKVHKPCGARLHVLMGHMAICPKCPPEEWAEEKARDGIRRGR
jgi:hypothetical protein